jgi:hypothetical protein
VYRHTLDKEAAANTAYTTRYDNHQYDETNYDWCPSENKIIRESIKSYTDFSGKKVKHCPDFNLLKI